MNSVLQAVFAAPEVSGAFGELGPALLKSAPEDPSADLLAQLAKLRAGLCTERYALSGEAEEAVCVAPRMLKTLVGKEIGLLERGAVLLRREAEAEANHEQHSERAQAALSETRAPEQRVAERDAR